MHGPLTSPRLNEACIKRRVLAAFPFNLATYSLAVTPQRFRGEPSWNRPVQPQSPPVFRRFFLVESAVQWLFAQETLVV